MKNSLKVVLSLTVILALGAAIKSVIFDAKGSANTAECECLRAYSSEYRLILV